MKNNKFFSVKTAIIIFLIFMSVNFLINYSSFGISRLIEITGGPSILDMELMGYSSDRAYEVIGALGEEGRYFTLKYIAPLDIPFPICYGLFYFVTLTVITKHLWKNIKRPWIVGIWGILGTVFDLSENIMVSKLLHSYPNRLDGVAKIASLFTQLKTFFIVSSMCLIFVGLLIIIVKKFYSKKTAIKEF